MQRHLLISIEPSGADSNYQVIKFDGELDKAGHTEIKEELDKIVLEFPKKTLVFDFKNLKFINSEGIGYLMEIHSHLVKTDKKLVIIGVNSHVNDVFKAIGITQLVPLFDDFDSFLEQNK
ncbi:STAS domain-containing protein [Candidatus Peregrinibacteria bacterium]|nr:STAS domain-containing protein [Candidatus Peregrinibacteria bacterium]